MQNLRSAQWLHPLWCSFLLMIAVSCGQKKNYGDNSAATTPTQSNAPVASPTPQSAAPSTPNPSAPKAAPADAVQGDANGYPTPINPPQNPANPANGGSASGYPQVVVPGATPSNGQAPATTPAAPAPSQGNLWIIISGNGTCNPRRDSWVVPGLWSTDLFDNFVGRVWNQGFVRPNEEMIFICYEFISPQMYFYAAQTQPTMIPIHEAQVDSLVLSRIHNPRKIIMIGYSYGGWRVMKLASSPLLLAATQAPIVLVTVDPISRMNCDGPFGEGCHSAPSDFSQQEMYYLNTRTTWLNTFEQGSPIVSSGPISAAHQNLEFGGLHVNMAKNPGVWNAIVGWLARFR